MQTKFDIGEKVYIEIFSNNEILDWMEPVIKIPDLYGGD